MSRATKRVFFTVVGVVLVVAVAAAGTAFALSRDDDESSTTYCAVMPDSIGLYKGNPVTQMGYRIGKVESIESVGTAVRVEFSALTSRPLPADVAAVTRSKSVLADRSLELIGNYSSGPRLKPGVCVTKAYTPKSISEITGSAGDLIDQIAPNGDTEALQGALMGLSDAIDGTGTDIASVLTTAGRAAQSPDQAVSDLGTIINSIAPLSVSAVQHWPQIESISLKLADSLESAGTVLWPGAKNIVAGITPVLQLLTDLQNRYSDDLWPALDRVADGLHIASLHVGEIEKAIQVLPGLADKVSVAWRQNRGGAQVTVRGATALVRTPSAAALCKEIGSYTSCVPASGDPRAARIGVDGLFSLAGAGR